MKRLLWPRFSSGRALAFVVVLAPVVIGGCSFGGGGNGTEPPATKTVIKDYSVEDPASLQNLELLVMQGESAIAEVESYITSSEPRERFLAVYVIGRVSTADTVKPLLPLLEDDNEMVRVAAAGTLANKGYVEALPVLITGLAATSSFEWLHPASPLAEFSEEVLTAYTGQAFGSDQAAWQQWWDATGAQLKWNAETETYQAQ